jgi:hypothetical protein
MHKLSRLIGIAACAAAFAAAGCSSNSGVTPATGLPMTAQQQAASNQGWIHENGVTYHVPHYMGTVSMQRPTVKPNAKLTYGNGPVLVTPKAYVIFWGFKTYGDRHNVRALLKNYVENMGGSGHNNIYTQYYQIVKSVKTFITNPSDQGDKSSIWSDNTTPVPAHPSDAQVAAEALVGVAHFGYNPNGSYVVATPHGHSTPGFGSQFCAYHSATTYNSQLVSYTNLPYMPDQGTNCGSNFIGHPSDETGADEGVTIVEGHEYGESVTDPNPPSGWYDFPDQQEIGDLCAWTNVLNDPFGTFSYTSQPMFSNATSSCVHTF